MDKPSYPALPSTTFVQTDTATFKELVQRLTGPPQDLTATASTKLSGLKRLNERRLDFPRPKLTITRPNPTSFSQPNTPVGLSPAAISPTLLSPSIGLYGLHICGDNNMEIVGSDGCGELNGEEEERATKERRFYLHPSPRSSSSSSRGMVKPELLPLFPVISPKVNEL